MPFQKNNTYSKGVGRPSRVKEQIRTEVINKSWELLHGYLNDSKLNAKDKRTISLEVAKKTIPKEVELGENASQALIALLTQK